MCAIMYIHSSRLSFKGKRPIEDMKKATCTKSEYQALEDEAKISEHHCIMTNPVVMVTSPS